MTKIQCRYGKANFELTKACLVPHDDGMPASPAPPPNFGRHFSRIQAAMKIRSRHGGRLPSETSPHYSPLTEAANHAAEHLAHEKNSRATAAHAAAGYTDGADAHGIGASRPPAGAEAGSRPARLPQLSVALTSSLLAIGVAIVVGLAIGKGGAFRNTGTPTLPPFGSRHAAAGPIVPPAAETASSLPAAPADSVALIEKPAAAPSAPVTPSAPPAPSTPAMTMEPAAAEKEVPAETPATAARSPQRKLKAAGHEAAGKARHVRKKKHRKARVDPPSQQNPFTGDKLPYSAQAPSPPAPPSTRTRLEQCRHLSSLIRSELCRWRICKNKWGRDGCPSYTPANPGGIGMRSAVRPYRSVLN